MELAYMVCFFLGLAYAVMSAIFSGLLGGHGGDAGGHDIGGTDGHMGHAGTPDGADSDGTMHFSPLSPVTIAMFITSFGGAGIILMRLLNVTQAMIHIPVSLVAGLAVGGLTFAVFYKVFQATQSSSESRLNDLAGLQAEVTTSIPSEGLGEITYVSRGSRFNAPAKSEDRKIIATHTPVVIKKVLGNTFFVEPLEKKNQA